MSSCCAAPKFIWHKVDSQHDPNDLFCDLSSSQIVMSSKLSEIPGRSPNKAGEREQLSNKERSDSRGT